MTSPLTSSQTDWLRELLTQLFVGSEGQQIPADKLFQSFCREKRLNSSNRRLLAEAFFGFLRRYWCVRKIAGRDDVPSLLTTWLSMRSRGVLPATSSLEKRFASSWTLVAEGPDRDLVHPPLPSSFMSESVSDVVPPPDPHAPDVLANLSPDLWPLFRNSFSSPESALEEALAFQTPAPCDLRINTFAGFTKSAVVRNLCAEGIVTDELPLDGVRLLTRPALKNLSLYRQGAFEVQDFGSQIVTHLCPVRPGMRILDYCAGGGGKTLALLNALASKGTIHGSIVVTDVDPRRLNRARLRFARIANFPHDAVHLVAFSTLSTEAPRNLFDLVLVDAPCSGLGTLRRNPDKAIFLTAEEVARYAVIQRTVLDAALQWVRPGGLLAYITCSVLNAENEAVIESALAQHSNLAPMPIRWPEPLQRFPPARLSPLGLQLTPRRTQTDGLFLALLKKK